MISSSSPHPARRARRAHRAASAARARAGAALTLSTLLAAVLAGSALPARAEGPVVGHVSLLIGEAKVLRRSGVVEALHRGASILVGDRVETGGNGHVHVRFVDNGAVSVRPDSSLEVQAYRYDAQNPQGSEVRLVLDQGTSRSISGRATEVDKTRFRLNTPLAAIGVRGTDFIVQASDGGVRATVAEGAIVVGALGAGCSAAALGPCQGEQAKLLSAEMGRLMVEVQREDKVARVVPAAGALLVPGAVDERVMAQRAADAAARQGGMLAAEKASPNDRVAAEALTLAAFNRPDLNSKPAADSQLAWRRYSLAADPNDKLSDPSPAATIGRHYTVGTSYATLFRADDPARPDRLLTLHDGKFDFRLSRAQATFESAGRPIEAALFHGGKLTLDFGQRSFATALDLSSPSGGRAELRAAGDLRPDGSFAVRDSSQFVTGATSLDGKEVGYLFERSVVGGLFRGKTLWGR